MSNDLVTETASYPQYELSEGNIGLLPNAIPQTNRWRIPFGQFSRYQGSNVETPYRDGPAALFRSLQSQLAQGRFADHRQGHFPEPDFRGPDHRGVPPHSGRAAASAPPVRAAMISLVAASLTPCRTTSRPPSSCSRAKRLSDPSTGPSTSRRSSTSTSASSRRTASSTPTRAGRITRVPTPTRVRRSPSSTRVTSARRSASDVFKHVGQHDLGQHALHPAHPRDRFAGGGVRRNPSARSERKLRFRLRARRQPVAQQRFPGIHLQRHEHRHPRSSATTTTTTSSTTPRISTCGRRTLSRA